MATSLPALKKPLKRRTSSQKLATKKSFKKWGRTAKAKRFEKIEKDPAKMTRHIKQVRIPKLRERIKSGTAKLKTLTGVAKSAQKRKVENNKIRLKRAQIQLRELQTKKRVVKTAK